MGILLENAECHAANLKKARAVLAVLLETMPVKDMREDDAWLISLAHDTIHDTIEALELEVETEFKARAAIAGPESN